MGLKKNTQQHKFYLLLNGVIDQIYKSYAIDVFKDQHLNIDGSGNGSLDIFKKNLLNYDIHSGKNTEIIQGDSTDHALDLLSRLGKASLRFISIDGGHTPEHTVCDLSLANQLINNQGVVILDDILNYHWMGVIEGLGNFLDSKPTLVPFAIGHNKLFLSKLSYQAYYYKVFCNSQLFTKSVNFKSYTIAAL